MSGSEWQKFKDHLARQLRFIERSCEAYDQGYTDEAIRIAVQIRVILHPGGKRRRSLLQHLTAGRIPLLTTSEGAPERPGLIEYIGMGSFRFQFERPNRYRQVLPRTRKWPLPRVHQGGPVVETGGARYG